MDLFKMQNSGQIARPMRLVGLIATVAIVAKVIILFAVVPRGLDTESINAAMFPDGYDQIAWNLVNGYGYRMSPETSLTMLRTPGFVMVLASLFLMFGKSLMAVQLANVLFSIATAVLVFQVTRRVMRSVEMATIASLIVFLHPATIVADSRGGPESLMMLLMALCLWVCDASLRNLQMRWFVWLGMGIGLLMLVKSSVALILPGVAAWEMLRRRQSSEFRRVVAGFSIACVVSGLVLAPWIARNFAISGAFVPTMTVGGLAAFQGQYVVKNILTGKDHWVLLEEAAEEQMAIADEMQLPMKGHTFPEFYSVDDELSFYSRLREVAVDGYRTSPSLIAKAVVYNSIAFWVQGKTWRATFMNTVLTVPLLFLAILGWQFSRQKKYDVSLLINFAALYILPHLLIMSLARYSVPVLPIVSILAAAGLVSIWRRIDDWSGNHNLRRT